MSSRCCVARCGAYICAMTDLSMLLDRASVSDLRDPAPADGDLDLILQAGLRAPDHGKLRPQRFVLIRG